MKLGQVFDPRNNALNAIRLALAAEVMLFHSWPITGRMPPAAIRQVSSQSALTGSSRGTGFGRITTHGRRGILAA